MDKAIKTLRLALTRFSKAQVAVALDLADNQTINNWLSQNCIPLKYKNKIDRLTDLISVTADYKTKKD